jgi:Zn-dependent M16 (insulinase) family peptidase
MSIFLKKHCNTKMMMSLTQLVGCGGGRRWLPFMFALPLFIVIVSCTTPARYVIISDNIGLIRTQNIEQRLICLSSNDAEFYRNILNLRTKSDIEKYGLNRTPYPVEEVLYRMTTEDYNRVEELLTIYRDNIPEYLRLLLRADLAAEKGGKGALTKQLVNLYQDAMEVQPCKISRDILNFRIRQGRYGR